MVLDKRKVKNEKKEICGEIKVFFVLYAGIFVFS